jgi:hypothetical protein
MGNNRIPYVLILFLTTLCLFPATDTGSAAPAISNESLIEGEVSGYAVILSDLIGIKPRQKLYMLTIKIDSSRSNVRFLSKKELSPGLFGKRIKANARYKGDERGGTYWIHNIEVIK